jgi:hypothetical protein
MIDQALLETELADAVRLCAEHGTDKPLGVWMLAGTMYVFDYQEGDMPDGALLGIVGFGETLPVSAISLARQLSFRLRRDLRVWCWDGAKLGTYELPSNGRLRCLTPCSGV